MKLYLVMTLATFYLAQLEEYHTGVLRTNQNGVGLTECQLLLVSLLMLQGVTGGAISEITMRHIGM